MKSGDTYTGNWAFMRKLRWTSGWSDYLPLQYTTIRNSRFTRSVEHSSTS